MNPDGEPTPTLPHSRRILRRKVQAVSETPPRIGKVTRREFHYTFYRSSTFMMKRMAKSIQYLALNSKLFIDMEK